MEKLPSIMQVLGPPIPRLDDRPLQYLRRRLAEQEQLYREIEARGRQLERVVTAMRQLMRQETASGLAGGLPIAPMTDHDQYGSWTDPPPETETGNARSS